MLGLGKNNQRVREADGADSVAGGALEAGQHVAVLGYLWIVENLAAEATEEERGLAAVVQGFGGGAVMAQHAFGHIAVFAQLLEQVDGFLKSGGLGGGSHILVQDTHAVAHGKAHKAVPDAVGRAG